MTYKYEFKYIVDDVVITMEFPADINITVLKENFRQFLLGCSWHQETIDEEFELKSNNHLDGN